MMALKNLWLRGTGSGESCASPFRNEHLVACDVLMTELDFHIKELEYIKQEQKQEERRLKTGVDYSWLMEVNTRGFEMSQMERLELEQLCCKVTGSEVTQVISLFRDSISRDPPVEDLPFILRSCVKKILDERPNPESLYDWVWKWTPSLASFSSLRSKVTRKIPSTLSEAEDIEMQSKRDNLSHRFMSLPNISVRDSELSYSV